LRQQRWSADSLELLFSLTPANARRVEGDTTRMVALDSIEAGDRIELLPGESVPVDGRVTSGTSLVDQSLLTGEAEPIPVTDGSIVHAGTVNVSSPLRIEVQATGSETRVARLMRLVEEYSTRKAAIVQLADRVAGWFVVAVIGLAAFTLGLWLYLDPPRAVEHAAALLIVTCPCALGLATPLAIAVAIGRCAGQGILIKGGDALEHLARGGSIWLDKTGTITEGRTRVVQWHGPEEYRAVTAALEAHSTHPVGHAFVEAYRDDESEALPVDSVTVEPRRISGRVAGRAVMVGSPAAVQSDVVGRVSPWVRDAESMVTGAALTPIWVAVDGTIVAVAGLGDPLRGDAMEIVDELRRSHWHVGLVSGDHRDVVLAVGRRLGIDEADIHGNAEPERKADLVASAVRDGPVVMVGDGVNDAAALAAATVGVAVHGGAEASLAAADVYLSRPGLRPIADLIRASRRTLRVIRGAIGVSIVYNVVAATLAIGGLIHPIVAAILMPISSFTVLFMALSARTFGETPCPSSTS
jgi:Cu2+-exporting ATPase